MKINHFGYRVIYQQGFFFFPLKCFFPPRFYWRSTSVGKIIFEKYIIYAQTFTDLNLRERYRFLPALPSLEHSHVHLFTYCLWLLSHCNSEPEQLQQRTYACKTENIYSLALYRKKIIKQVLKYKFLDFLHQLYHSS